MRTVTLKGNPFDLSGTELKVGQKAPDFHAQLNDLSDANLSTFAGKTRILCAVPSIDTPVCDTEMRKFNEKASALENTVVVCVSMDTPFALKRWQEGCGAGLVVTASDHRSASFGGAYGCLIANGPLERCLSRAVFVIGPDDVLRHVEYVPEIAQEPAYDAALDATGIRS